MKRLLMDKFGLKRIRSKPNSPFASPILTRLYSPEAFGFLAIFISITSIVGVIACMRYELAIMLLKSDEKAANLLALCLLSVVAISGLTVPALYFGSDAIISLLKAPGLDF